VGNLHTQKKREKKLLKEMQGEGIPSFRHGFPAWGRGVQDFFIYAQLDS
jgi:hypothetical protein